MYVTILYVTILYVTILYVTFLYVTILYVPLGMEETMAPFVFGRMAKEDNFTNREKETAHLAANFSSLVNTMLISPRRLGKSSLVMHAVKKAMQKDKKLRCCFIDLFTVRNEEEFYRSLAEAVLKATSSRTADFIRKAGKYFSHIVPKFTYSPDPSSDVEVGFNWEEVKKRPEELINLAESIAKEENIKIVVCIDEFQNIGLFDDPKAFQKRLRANWQKHQHVSYCLYGSKRHMLMEVFASPSMPFYKFGDILFLEKIAEKDWVPFIIKRFKDTGKSIDENLSLKIARMVECHPFYVQQLAQLTWFRTKKSCTKEEIDIAFSSLLDQLGLLFQSITETLATTQVNFLKAVCENVVQLTAQENLVKYKLGSSGNVKRIKEALLEKEIIDIQKKKIVILDPVYKTWLKEHYFGRK